MNIDDELYQFCKRNKISDLAPKLQSKKITLSYLQSINIKEFEQLSLLIELGINEKISFRHAINKLQTKYKFKNNESQHNISKISFSTDPSKYDFLFKILLIGDTKCGKSMIDLKFTSDKFHTSYISTIGVDFHFRTIQIDDNLCKLQVWDTAGAERFRTITTAYYKSADAVFIIYDITNRESFEHIENWLSELEYHQSSTNNIYKMIIGNKIDLIQQRVVNTNEGKELADNNNMEFMETSALTGLNINNVFEIAAEQLIKNYINAKIEKEKLEMEINTVNINQDSSCCIVL